MKLSYTRNITARVFNFFLWFLLFIYLFFYFTRSNFYDCFCFSSIASTSSRCSSPRGVTLRMPPVVTSAQVNALLQQSNKWRLMPQVLKQGENSTYPSTYYGAIHLTRLFGEL